MPPPGFRLLPQRLSIADQQRLIADVTRLAEAAPFRRQRTPGGKTMSVAMTNFGPLGWVTDAAGYRYEPRDPLSGRAWPPIPEALLRLWAELCDADVGPDCCLANLYGPAAKMGLHRDRDEADFRFPVLSVSLGDSAWFRIGGLERSEPTSRLRLASGDVLVLGGEARLAHHGVDRIVAGSSQLVPGGGRINLTLRRARPA